MGCMGYLSVIDKHSAAQAIDERVWSCDDYVFFVTELLLFTYSHQGLPHDSVMALMVVNILGGLARCGAHFMQYCVQQGPPCVLLPGI